MSKDVTLRIGLSPLRLLLGFQTATSRQRNIHARMYEWPRVHPISLSPGFGFYLLIHVRLITVIVRSCSSCIIEVTYTTHFILQGDSGGPLVCRRNGRFYVAGIASWAIVGCQRKGFPNAFTKVANYVDWIHDKIGNGWK